ncbi:MAG: hypothetical protein JW864_14965 [Spirochaetes bacterium]|nr:hypothetical protein [Spirochaetota bacterium]
MGKKDQITGLCICRYIILILLFCLILVPSEKAVGLDYHGKIDTRYQYRGGDDEADQDIYQYHSFNLEFLKNLTFEWFGGLRKDLDGTNSSSDGLEDASDVSLRGLPDAANEDQTLEYRIYTAFFKYNTEKYGALLGRSLLWDYEFSEFDGIKAWGSIVDWLKLEGFAGKPWHYGYYNDISNYWDENEFIAGTGSVFSFPEYKLDFALRYINLREQTEKETEIDEPSDTFISNDNLFKGNISYKYSEQLRAYLSVAYYETTPRNIDFSLNGYSGNLMLGYRLNFYQQFMDIDDFGNRLTQFSSFLTASRAYQRVSADAYKSLANIFNLTGPVNDVEVGCTYEYRRPLYDSDESQFNPEYHLIRAGLMIAMKGMYYVHGFYENITTVDTQNDMQAFGGEFSKKWKKMSVRLGTSYYAHKYEAQYSETLIKDSFYAREYYLRFRWKPLEYLDVSLKGSYEIAEITSLTDTSNQNQDINAESVTEIITEPRDYYKFEIQIGYTF